MGKPVAAIIMASLGLVLQAMALIFELFAVFLYSAFTIKRIGPFIIARSAALMVFGFIIILVGTVGIYFMSRGYRGDVFIGSILEIVASIFAYPTLFGFFLGSFLMFLGGVIGLLWAPIKGS